MAIQDTVHIMKGLLINLFQKVVDEGVRSAVDVIAKIDDQLQSIKEKWQNQVQRVKDGISGIVHLFVNRTKSKTSYP